MGKQSPTPDNSGVIAAQASSHAADVNYQMGQDQLAFEKQQWATDQPLINQVANTDVQAQQSNNDFTKQQQDFYKNTYQPLESTYANQVQNYDTPAQEQQNAGAAEATVGTQFDGARNAAMQQLEGYGVDPTSTRYAALDIGTRAQQGAATAAAGTGAIQQTKLQGLGLEAGAINIGRGYANNQGALTGATTGAGSGAAGATLGGLTASSGANASTTGFTNAASGAMGQYTNAVNGFNLAQNQASQTANQGAMGFGSLAGGIFGAMMPVNGLDDGGPVDNQSDPAQGIPTDQAPMSQTPNNQMMGAIPTNASPSGGQTSDDVPARLTAGEFVTPKDVTEWYGQKFLVGLVDKARKEKHALNQRTDIGGKPVSPQTGIPANARRAGQGPQGIPAGMH